MDLIMESVCQNLSLFDPDAKEIEVTTDASKNGMGAHIAIRGRIVSFASNAFTKTEQNYALIDKELRTIVYECKRFH